MLHIHPSQPKDVISPAYPGSTPRSPPGGTLLDRPTEEVPLVIIPSQLPPVDTEEHGLYPKYLDSTPCLCGWAQLNPATNHSSTSWQSLLHETTKPRHLPELKLNQTLCAPWLLTILFIKMMQSIGVNEQPWESPTPTKKQSDQCRPALVLQGQIACNNEHDIPYSQSTRPAQ